ncbi:MAG: LPS export ABC transporter periplasmic protein LptC [Ottowia sp.]
MIRRQLLRRSRDLFFAWLPALFMGLAALGTWWLVRSAPQMAPAPADAAAPGQADYFMREFTVQTFAPDGRLKTRVTGVEGHHYPDTDTLKVQSPRLQSWGEGGEITLATAASAEARGDGSQVELIGQARVERHAAPPPAGSARAPVPPLVFEGERLLALIDAEQVKSALPVQITQGADRFTADTFEYDHATGVALLSGRVRGTLAPRR